MKKLRKNTSMLSSYILISCTLFLSACVSNATTSPLIITSTYSSTSVTTTPPIMTTIQPATTTILPTATTSIPPPTTNDAPVPTAKVTVNSSGFVPDTLVIPVGTVVIWKSLEEQNCSVCHGNDSLGLNPHIFGFYIDNGIDIGVIHMVTSDSALFFGELPPQGIFVKYFSSAGTYTYHDSLNPKLEGKIIVQ